MHEKHHAHRQSLLVPRHDPCNRHGGAAPSVPPSAIDCRAGPGGPHVSLPETLIILTAECAVRVKIVRIVCRTVGRLSEGGVR